MLDLITRFSLSQCLIFIILLGLAFKELYSFLEWLNEKGIKIFKNKYQNPKDKEQVINNLEKNVEQLTKKVNILLDSDRDDIKAFITRQHHYFCYQLKEIDDQSLDCIEKRYSHYQEEGGNSYIKNLMEDLRELPKTPPKVTLKK